MRNLRSTYYQGKKKFEKSKASGSSFDDIYVPNLKWFNKMDGMLKSANEKRTTYDNYVSAQNMLY